MQCIFDKIVIKKIILQIVGIILFIASESINAATPFITDDPDILSYKHWEVILFSVVNKNNDFFLEPDLFLPVIEVNYGIFHDTELDITVPFALSLPNAAPFAKGIGDMQIELKYQLIHETKHMPEIGLAPILMIPTGNANLNLGNGTPWARLPILAQKSWGKWTSYGGCGYAINSAPGNLNFFYAGWLLQKDLNDLYTVGGEILYQTAMTVDGSASLIFNAGAVYNFNKNFSLQLSGGHSIAGQEQLVGYLGLYWTFGKDSSSSLSLLTLA